MSIEQLGFRLPRNWTPQQAEFLWAVLEDIAQAIWETYEDELLQLWRDRDGDRFPTFHKLDAQPKQPDISMEPRPRSDDEENIPW